jgi:O-acetyl-ADP-ribose deacetylase (regulator of RNase III)
VYNPAFPNISTGVYGCPREKAAAVAAETVRSALDGTLSIARVIFVCFGEENYWYTNRAWGGG